MPGELIDGRIRVTNYGLISGEGAFLSTRCQPFNYQKQGTMLTAQTFRKSTQNEKVSRNHSVGITSIFDSRL